MSGNSGTENREHTSANLGELVYHHKVHFQYWLIIVVALFVLVAIAILQSQRDIPLVLLVIVGSVLAFLPIGLLVQERRLSRDEFFFHAAGFRCLSGSSERVIYYSDIRDVQYASSTVRVIIFLMLKEGFRITLVNGEIISVRYRHPPKVGIPKAHLAEIRDFLYQTTNKPIR